MEIYFDFELSTDDIQELINNFGIIIHNEWKVDVLTGDTSYWEASVDTKDLLTLEFDDYIKFWLDAWYELKLKNDKYMITT